MRFEPPFFGLVKDRPETELSPNELSHAKDVVLDKHRIAKRRGSLRISFFSIPSAAIAFHDDDQLLQSRYVSESDYSSHALGTKFTMEICGQGDAEATHTFMAMAERGYWRSSESQGWSVYFDRLNRVFRFRCKVDTGNDIDLTGTYTAYAPGKPFHLAIRRNGTDAWMYLGDGDFSGKIGEVTNLTASSVETHTLSPLEFGRQVTGFNPGVAPEGGFRGRLAEFRTWDYNLATTHIDEHLLEELPPHVKASNSLRFYVPMNEGAGQFAEDVGFHSRSGTETALWRLSRRPSAPRWVSGLAHGGIGDYAVRFDGREDWFFAFSQNDIYSAFRTGTSDWAFEALVRPLPMIEDESVFAHMGFATFTPASEGFAFQVACDASDPTDKKFRVRFCTATETVEVLYSSGFTHGKIYGVHVQRQREEARVRIDNITDDQDGSWETVTLEGDGPEFPEGVPLLLAAPFPSVIQPDTQPQSGFCATDIDEVRLWRSARASDLRSILAGRADDELVGYWPFQDGDGVVVTDNSKNRQDGVLSPQDAGPPWEGGFVTPLFGPEVEGLFYYQRSENLNSPRDARERTLLAAGGPSVYRQEGVAWQELRTQLTPGTLWAGAQLGTHMILVNGVDENMLFDGTEIWDAGLDPPDDPATAQITALTEQGPFDEVNPNSGSRVGATQVALRDEARVEPTGQFDGKRLDIGFTTGTVEARVFKYFLNRLFILTRITNLFGVSGFGADQFYIKADGLDTKTRKGAVTTKGVPPGGLEGAFFQVHDTLGNTTTFQIIQDGFSGAGLPGQYWNRWIKCDKSGPFAGGGVGATPVHPENILKMTGGHFILKSPLSSVPFSTTSYAISLFDAGVTGPFFYRYTHVNRFTGIESNPSPPIDGAVSPNQNAVILTVPGTDDENVTDRGIYRTRFQGGGPGGKGEQYFRLGTLTGSSTSTFYDLTPDGQEGRLISFFRAKPPRSYLVHQFRGRMFYVPVTTPNRVYFSETGKPAEVDDVNWRSFGESNDHITGIASQGDNLIVFKRRSVWALLRTDVRGAMRVFQIHEGIGCVSHHTIRTLPDGTLIFLSDKGVYVLSGFELTRVSDGTIQFYIDRLDPERLERAVAADLKDSGIYRLNASPFSLWATTVVSGRNAWHLDYHYSLSRQVQRPVWTYGEREVSYYGQFISEDGVEYPAFGDYLGFCHIDNLPLVYSEGLGWYRNGISQAFTFDTAGDVLAAGTYTLPVSGDLFAQGDRLKGLRISVRSATAVETHTVARSFTNTIVIESPLSNTFSAGDQIFVAPIDSRIQTGWLRDPGGARAGKKVRKMAVGHLLATTSATFIVESRRILSGVGRETHSVNLGTPQDSLEMQGRARYYRLEFQHAWPGEWFELFSVDLDTEPQLER